MYGIEPAAAVTAALALLVILSFARILLRT